MQPNAIFIMSRVTFLMIDHLGLNTHWWIQLRQEDDIFLLLVIDGSAIYFLAHLAKGHVSFCHHLASVVRRKLSHFNLLLRNHWANCNQALMEWSLDGPLPKVCPVILTSNQDGRKAKNRKKGGWNFNCPLLL